MHKIPAARALFQYENPKPESVEDELREPDKVP